MGRGASISQDRQKNKLKLKLHSHVKYLSRVSKENAPKSNVFYLPFLNESTKKPGNSRKISENVHGDK